MISALERNSTLLLSATLPIRDEWVTVGSRRLAYKVPYIISMPTEDRLTTKYIFTTPLTGLEPGTAFVQVHSSVSRMVPTEPKDIQVDQTKWPRKQTGRDKSRTP